MQGIFLALRVPFLFIQILILILGKHHLLLLSWKYYFLNFSAVTFVLQVSEFFFPCVWFCICFSHGRLFTNHLETLALESRSEALCGRTGLWSPGRLWVGLAERLLGKFISVSFSADSHCPWERAYGIPPAAFRSICLTSEKAVGGLTFHGCSPLGPQAASGLCRPPEPWGSASPRTSLQVSDSLESGHQRGDTAAWTCLLLNQTPGRSLRPQPASAPARKVHARSLQSGSHLCPPLHCLQRVVNHGCGNGCPSYTCLPASETSSAFLPFHWSCFLGVKPPHDPFTVTCAGFERSPQSAWFNGVWRCDSVKTHTPHSPLPPHPWHGNKRAAFTDVRTISPSPSIYPASLGD